MIKNKLLIVGAFWMLLLIGCDTNAVHKDLVDFDDYQWAVADIQSFDFEVKDSSALYNVNYLLRNAIHYPFYNIYLKSSLKDSSGQVLSTGMEELILFDEVSGKPLGDGLGDLFDHRIAASPFQKHRFPYKGKYTLDIQQNMRPDPLVGIMSIGFELLLADTTSTNL